MSEAMTPARHIARAEDMLRQLEDKAQDMAPWPHDYTMEVLGRVQAHIALASYKRGAVKA